MKDGGIESSINKLFQSASRPTDLDEEKIRALASGDLEGPFHFVNLLRFTEIAHYPDDHELSNSQLTGAEAYDMYGALAFAQVTKRGGRLVTLNDVELVITGFTVEWHRIGTMEYRSINAFIDMLLDPEYQEALVHREAGLEATEIIVSRPILPRPNG